MLRYMLIALVLLALPAVSSAAEPPANARPASPPPGATIAVPGAQLRLAKNGLGQALEVKSIDDPANPYAGQYSAVDRWYFEHYVPAVTPEEEKHFGG